MKMVYKFYATWCQPCRVLTQRLDAKGITLPGYDIDNPDYKMLIEKYNIRSVPTIIIDDDGLVQRFVGAVDTKELYEALAS